MNAAATEYRFLRAPTDEELAQIIGLYRAAGWWGEAPDDPEHVARLVGGSHCFLVAERAGHVVAMGRAISDRVSDAYIHDLTVHPDHRGQGVATELVRRLLERLRADGLRWYAVIAEAGSHPLYTPFGFAPMPAATPLLKLDN